MCRMHENKFHKPIRVFVNILKNIQGKQWSLQQQSVLQLEQRLVQEDGKGNRTIDKIKREYFYFYNYFIAVSQKSRYI